MISLGEELLGKLEIGEVLPDSFLSLGPQLTLAPYLIRREESLMTNLHLTPQLNGHSPLPPKHMITGTHGKLNRRAN